MAVKTSFPFRPQFNFRNIETGESVIYENPEFFRFLHDLWKRTGGFDDLIDNSAEAEIPFVSADVIDLQESLEDFYRPTVIQQAFYGKTVTSDYTALAFEFLAVSNNATIKLPAEPDDNDQIIVLNVKNSTVTTSGNGKNINDDTSTITRSKNRGIVYQYFVDLDQWYMR